MWTEGKRQHERGATTLERAKEIAHEEAARLWTQGERPVSTGTPFAALVSAATDPRHRTWTDEWALRVERIARIHIIPALGQMPASQLSRQPIAELFANMAAAGYSYQFLRHTRNIIKLAVDEGIQRGVWEGSRNPLVGVSVPRPRTGPEDGRPDQTMIPTDIQVGEFIMRMASDRPVYGVMAAVAAYTGLRWGELLAMTIDSVDLATKRLRVTHTCVESDQGRFRFRTPGKRNARTREVILEDLTEDVLRVWIKELDKGWAPGSHIEGDFPGRLIFCARSGNPFRRSAYGKVFWRHAHRVAGWPVNATWHYLRHYAATRWIRLGVEVPTVSAMLGHRQISTTYDWYVNVDAQALERAAKTLRST